MLSKVYNQLFTQNVEEFCVNILNEKNYDDDVKRFHLFYPLIGKDFLKNRELVVMGQATNGWHPQFSIEDVRRRLSEIIAKSIDYSKEPHGCSLEWVNRDWSSYQLYRSFFWNITYKLVMQFYGKSAEDWNNIIAWSNLMKIAPAGGGNPDNITREAQMLYSAKLFQKEIEDLQPKNVLLLTNLAGWAKPILELSGITYSEVDGAFVQAIAHHGGSRIIVTRRGFLSVTHKDAVAEVSKYLIR